MNAYFISGLGADRNIFKYIELPEEYSVMHLDWIPPLKNETLGSYSARMAQNIDLNTPYVVIGLSLGGMIAAEISRQFAPAKTILISSVSSHKYLPGYFRMAAAWRLYNLVPVEVLKQASMIKRLFTAESSEDKKMVADLIRQSDPAFIRWAIGAVLQWNAGEPEKPFIHIHGTRDEVFPLRYVKPSHVIKGGDHLLVLTWHREVNRILKEVLDKK